METGRGQSTNSATATCDGCVFMTIPNVGGFAMWSPRLDPVGNSERAVHAATELVKYLAVHNFEVFSGLNASKMNIVTPKYTEELAGATKVFNAASFGDAQELNSILNSGHDVFVSDYDLRTPLHIAASEGQPDAVAFFIKAANGDQSKISAQDRWRGTPLGDAIRGAAQHSGASTNFEKCVSLLKAAGAKEDERGEIQQKEETIRHENDSSRALSAAADGDVKILIQMSAAGENIFACDYDARTALHLAASNGHLDVVKYLVAQLPNSEMVHAASQMDGSAIKAKLALLHFEDRFKGTPQDDAEREGHGNVWKFLHDTDKKLQKELQAHSSPKLGAK